MFVIKRRNPQHLSSKIETMANDMINVGVGDYPIWVLEHMLQDVERQRQHILLELEALRPQFTQKLAMGDIEAVQDIQVKVKKLRQKNQALEENRNKLFDCRQKKLLKERITSRLGGETNYTIKEIIITLLVIFVLGIMVCENFVSGLSRQTLDMFFWLDAGCCSVLLVDFFFELNLAESKRWFWRKHFIDFITSIPIPQARVLRAFRGVRVIRFLRFARFLRFLRVLRALFFFWRGLDHLVTMFNVRLMRKSLLYVLASLILGAVAFHFFEATGGPINTDGVVTSLWWSFTTVVTGGFADIHNPTTMGGKLLTVVLVILGMVIIGIFTATLTTVMVGDDDDLEQLKDNMNEQFGQLLTRVKQIEDRLN